MTPSKIPHSSTSKELLKYIKGHYYCWDENKHKIDDIKVKKCGVHVFYVDGDQIDETSSDASDEHQEMCNFDEMSKDVSYVKKRYS